MTQKMRFTMPDRAKEEGCPVRYHSTTDKIGRSRKTVKTWQDILLFDAYKKTP